MTKGELLPFSIMPPVIAASLTVLAVLALVGAVTANWRIR